ncbi:MAG: ParB N-terminal domain-containing protein [Lachnospiraceae bacterium]|nr:ParB N-terminal domain-containing protein [Clostridia bacterium]MBR1691165.1 ParB N-terminal domain-containing protein [Lachnospiraceae bacterium]
MEIKQVSTSRLKEYENNPRNNDLAVEKVRYSIERFGFRFPVVIDMNYTIVCGHTRVRAARELGLASVPCIIADDLTEEQINFFRLVDNKTSEYSDWDFEKLKNELAAVDLTLDANQLLLERFELSAEVFDIDAEQAEIKIPAFNFMGVNDDKKPAKEKKPPVKTIISEGNDEIEPDDEEIEAEDNFTAEPTESGMPFTETDDETPVAAPASHDRGESTPAAAPEEKKQSKGSMPFCQFRFGDVSFFISQLELDRLNDKYAEYIDSGEILKGSFASYLLKGVESRD